MAAMSYPAFIRWAARNARYPKNPMYFTMKLLDAADRLEMMENQRNEMGAALETFVRMMIGPQYEADNVVELVMSVQELLKRCQLEDERGAANRSLVMDESGPRIVSYPEEGTDASVDQPAVRQLPPVKDP